MTLKTHWDLLATVVVLAIGAALIALGHAEGRDLLTLGSGLLTGLVLGRRRNGANVSIPPGASVLAVAALAAATASGCGASSPGSTCRAVQSATRAVCIAAEQAERWVCEAPDGGAPPQ